MKDLMTSRPI